MPKKRKNRRRKSKLEPKKEENNNINDNNINNNEAEEKDDLLKITNIEYEKFIKENQNLFEYISESKLPLFIHNDKFQSDIDIDNSSFIKIIKQANLENEFKIYLTKQIITEEINYETFSSKSITFNPKAQNFVKNIENYNITFPNNKNGNTITINKKTFEKIFSMMNKNYLNDIFIHITFISIQVSYKYNEKQKSYVLNDKNLKKLMLKNKIFYFILNDIKIPLSNYSTEKIFNLFNGGKNTKYLLIRYKIIKDDDLTDNNSFLNKLINASDVKYIYKNYKSQIENNSFKTLKNEKLNKINEIDISDLNIFLTQASDKLTNILTQIKNKKEEIFKLSDKNNNQFILINIDEKNKYVNKQYLQLMKDKNIDNINVNDFSNEKILLSKKNLENSEEDNIYIEIIFNQEKYLIKKNDIVQIYDIWKILNQKEIIEVIDTKEFNNVNINFELLNINIIEQEVIEDIKDVEDNKDIEENKDVEENKDIEDIKENKDIEDDKDIEDNKNIEDNKEIKEMDVGLGGRKKINIFEYVKSLPKKKVYNIKYKIKIERIPKNK